MRTFKELFRAIDGDGDARHKLRSFNISQRLDGKAKSVKLLAESLGFSVRAMELPRGMAGRLVRDAFSDNGFEIQVNQSYSVQSQRWAVLHEMGHFFRKHVDRSDYLAADMFLDRSSEAFYVDQKEEVEANEFAAVVLYGDGALEAAKSLHGANTTKLAKVFGVSEKSIEYALKKFT
ncbi:Zn-dependent peptidase ImmA (M78 family) [Loktanella sp. PT4BL]|jgi:Zn-dependent peptidase ImmA (M78 family)|uniref:ImmA/IrrE family metallo-endopeptidase n=1 Tax=Loktanella sp. PT4BL TaxID=2135611 RepID=UPI000D7535A7|nr:ImmA/IrrE family metallo-endopeptidase [Loktanella sp. PT4BL]PXW70613.1 Zn-dependent peptidase ImmA (M78 family) [Loktanella sp. PT4BL]